MKGFFSALLLSVITVAQASTTPNIPAKKGEACTFQEGVRYSELVINSRIKEGAGLRAWTGGESNSGNSRLLQE